MKLKELIEKFEERKTIIGNFQGYAVWWEDVKEIFEQLDEQKTVKVPQFVADWIEHCRGLGYSLYQAMELVHENAEIKKWFIFVDNQDLFARAWLDGYEVEEEKRYLVKMKGIEINFNFLNRHRNENYWIFSSKDEHTLYQTQHTRKELEEADFGWVFDCPGVEIEEVE